MAVLATMGAGVPAVVMAGIALRLLACTMAARLLEMGLERLRQALSIQNPKALAIFNMISILAGLALRGWLVMRLFPAGESLTFKGVERVRVMDIVEGSFTKVIYEYRPVQWTRQVLPMAIGAQVAGLAARVALRVACRAFSALAVLAVRLRAWLIATLPQQHQHQPDPVRWREAEAV